MPHASRPTRDNGRAWSDGKAPDGFTVNGWRRVTQGGYVRFNGIDHFHKKFADWPGLWVFMELDDPWGVNANAWPDEPWKQPRTMLSCTDRSDWESKDRLVAAQTSRQRPSRSCNQLASAGSSPQADRMIISSYAILDVTPIIIESTSTGVRTWTDPISNLPSSSWTPSPPT